MKKQNLILALGILIVAGCASNDGVSNSQEALKPEGTPNRNKPVVGMGGAAGPGPAAAPAPK